MYTEPNPPDPIDLISLKSLEYREVKNELNGSDGIRIRGATGGVAINATHRASSSANILI